MVEKVKRFFAKPSRAVIAGYLSLVISSAAIIGVYVVRTDQAQLAAAAAKARADDALEELRQSCLDRVQARQDTDEVLLIIAGALSNRQTGERLRELILARPPIKC